MCVNMGLTSIRPITEIVIYTNNCLGTQH
uniref:Uncharacterized protein n=1 Tax=Anguilla anguilla TaxID=7936 RepID=A0A0E9RCX4_ANGAN